MPFDGVDPLFSTVALIDAVSDFFADEQRWTQGVFHDGEGRRCLAGAMRHVRRTSGISGDRMRAFIYAAQRRRGIAPGIMGFNDTSAGIQDIRALLHDARAAVMAAIEGQSNHRPPLQLALPLLHA
jgi:hypothetical protein